jgi:hypothetical protein
LVVPDTRAADIRDAFGQHGVVLEGSINPAIFQPRWLAAIGVMPFDEADAADPAIVSASVTAFRTSRLSVQVTSERAVFRTRRNGLGADGLGEIVSRILSELPHTPITSIDLVHMAHVPLHLINWPDAKGALVSVPVADAVLPGSDVAMLQLETHANDGSLVEVLVEPSHRTEGAMYMRVHREFSLEPVDTGSAGQALDLLNAHWQSSLEEASTILARMVENLG